MKKISKILSVVLAVVLSVFSFPVYAEDSDVVMTLCSDRTDVKAGDTVTLTVKLSENSNLNYYTIDLTYDNNVLEYVSHTIDDNAVSNESYTENSIRVAYASNTALADAETILTASFTALSSYCSNAYIDVREAGNFDLDELSVATNSISIHSYSDFTIDYEPACEENGQKSKSCSCGDTVYESITALGHDYSEVYVTDSDPTCTDDGSKSQHCSRCDSKQNVTSIPANGHRYIETVKEPTCTEKGLKTITCESCEYFETEDIMPTGHSYTAEITKIPTHTENGEEVHTCMSCGDSYTVVIEADGDHKYISSVTTEPTCIYDGMMTYTCACGDVYTESIDALGHSHAPTVEENYIAPTCTENGSRDYVVYCGRCSWELVRETVTLYATGHTEVVLPSVEATCTQSGYTSGSQCSVCGDSIHQQTEIPATGHSVNADGYCDNCDEKICDHSCHKGGIAGFFWKISNFFNKLFRTKQYCGCGYAHY